MHVSNTMDSRDEVSHSVLIFDCHALHHAILYVHVDPMWEAADQVHYHSTRLHTGQFFLIVQWSCHVQSVQFQHHTGR